MTPIILAVAGAVARPSETIYSSYLTRPEAVALWRPTHDISAITSTPEGMRVQISGPDPYVTYSGPPISFPERQPLWLRMRLRSDEGGTGQLFYFRRNTSEEDSVRFPVRPRVWEDIRVPMPPLGPGYRFRIDPPGGSGSCTMASLSFEPRALLQEPAWPKPDRNIWQDPQNDSAGNLSLYYDVAFSDFSVMVGGSTMASGHNHPLVGYEKDGKTRWVDVARSGKASSQLTKDGILGETTVQDPDGGTWKLSMAFNMLRHKDAIDVECSVIVDRDRSVVYLPMLVMLPGAGANSFGKSKGQGLFCGLEYLDNEPSSSEADLIGPMHNRRVPDSLKLTIPLMAIQAEGRYIGLIWDMNPEFSALFDSPDRTFNSGGHAMGILFPGSNGRNREEGSMLPYSGELLRANEPLVLRATIIGGKADSIVPAIQKYVALRGLHPVENPPDLREYVRTAAAGWLDSKINVGSGLYRHAFPGGFGEQPAADAAAFILWLAEKSTDSPLSDRLRQEVSDAVSRLNTPDYYQSGVSHVRFPSTALVFGGAKDSIVRARESAKSALDRLGPGATLEYKPSPGGLDYGRTHFSKEANGYVAPVVMQALEGASLCGDKDLIDRSITALRKLDRYLNTVPRGAQTWEVPLHTPDILASAYLVRAYTLGYELTGDRHLLNVAKYWAWTGVPFIYLRQPVPELNSSRHTAPNAIGPYATIPVLGATQWKAPIWMGLPVQWCGLVYSDALYRLSDHDPRGPWKQIADGITESGIRQTWPVAGPSARQYDVDRQGLLPDSFALRPQIRNDAAINPGTLQANAARFYGSPMYSMRRYPHSGIIIHAPGSVRAELDEPGRLRVSIHPWADEVYEVIVLKAPATATIRANGRPIDGSNGRPKQVERTDSATIISLKGDTTLELILR